MATRIVHADLPEAVSAQVDEILEDARQVHGGGVTKRHVTRALVELALEQVPSWAVQARVGRLVREQYGEDDRQLRLSLDDGRQG